MTGVKAKRIRKVKAKISMALAFLIIVFIAVTMVVMYFIITSIGNYMGETVLLRNVQRFVLMTEELVDAPADIVRVAASDAAILARYGDIDRETFWAHFNTLVEGSESISGMGFMFAPNAFDGNDSQYIGTPYAMSREGWFAGYTRRMPDGSVMVLPNVPIDEADYDQPFYTEVMRTKNIVLSKPYAETQDGKTYPMITVSAPMRCSITGEVLGVVLADIFLEKFFAQFSDLRIYDTAYALITTADGDIIYSPVETHWLRNAGDLNMRLASSPHEPVFDNNNIMSAITGDQSYALTMPVKFKLVDDIYYASLIIPWAEIFGLPYMILWGLGGAFALAVIILPLIVYRLVSKTLKPLESITAASHYMAEGNFDFNLPPDTGDEIGVLSNNFREMTDTLKRLIVNMEDMVDKHENGQASARLEVRGFKGTYAEVTGAINRMLDHSASVKSEAFGCIVEIVNGDFDARVRQFPGEEAVINDIIEGLRINITNVAQAIGRIIKHVSNGNLAYTLDATRYKGNWVGLITGLNEIMQAVHVPLAEATRVIRSIEQGDFSDRVSGEFGGEFLIIKDALNKTMDAVSSYIAEINDVLGKMATGDLRTTISREYIGQFASIRDSINEIDMEMNNTIREISNASDLVYGGAERISTSSSELAQGATKQASSLEELTAIINEIDSGSKENADNAQEAARLVEASKQNAESGSKEMDQLTVAMDEIAISSNKISNIIKTIEGIAFQTNLLALNASVEAARAGEHGRGFAVVADEVRNLAAKSDDAAKETNALILESINRVSEGTLRAGETAAGLARIVSDIMAISEVIVEIDEASAKQKEAVGSISSGITQINEVVHTNIANSEESAAAAEELNSQSQALQQMIAFFKTK